MDNQTLLKTRRNDLLTTMELKEPKRVPIMLDSVTWPVAYAQGDTDEWLDNPELMLEGYRKLYSEVFFDCITNPGIFTPLRSLQKIGSEGWGVSSDNVTVQHLKQTCVMTEDDYDAFIEDPIDTMLNQFSRRRFHNLTGNDEETYEILKSSAEAMVKHQEAHKKLNQITEDAGVVLLCSGGVRAPLDFLFSNIRGFNETLVDLVRRPEKVLKACEKILDFFGNPEAERMKETGPLPLGQSGNHSPCFIGKKKYEKFFWPFYKQMVTEVADAGGKIFNMLEGEGLFTLDFLREMPKGTFVLRLDQDDPYEVQKKIGDWATIACGISCAALKYKSKQECIDIAKKYIDDFAPGGGYIFTTDKPLVSASDADADNLIAVFDFVKDYGKY